MKKVKSILLASALLLCAPLAACGGNAPTSTKGTVQQGDKTIFPYSTSEGVYMGDVMPFYDDGVMNIYHLQDRTGSLYMFYHPFSRLTTTDYVSYKDEGIAINFTEDIDSPDASLGTGSFIKGADGKYHCFYTGHPANAVEVIRHAVSSDNQKTWVKDESFNIRGTSNDFRDPYVYYDSTDECYYMLVTTRKGDKGVIQQYKADSLDAASDGWTDNGTFFENDEGTYNMECPSYIEWNGFRYLAYSEQGDNRVTHYRYQTADSDEWKKFNRDTIDSTGFYAGRLEKAGDKLYAFAWCARLDGGDTGAFDWGGNLVAHEIKQEPDGSLRAVMIENVKNTFGNSVTYNRVNGENVSDFKFDGAGFKAYGVEKLSTNVTRMHFTVTLDSLDGDFGLTFGVNGDYDNRLGKNMLSFIGQKGRISCYNGVKNILRYGDEFTGINYALETGRAYDADIVIDGEILSLYFDNKIAFTTRFVGMQNKNFAFYSNGAKVQIAGIKFYE
ncbi:MAG: hypothetical protein K2J01_03060 [Clostridiales bacterium]|nr:hypothetical protein [Clostridiales bacterium]